MDTLNAPALIPRRAINMDIVAAAGEPGTPNRIAVLHALETLSVSPCWQHGGRGPLDFDWLGFARWVVAQTKASCFDAHDELGDAFGYSPSYEDGISIDTAKEIIENWGLHEIHASLAHPGDVILFGMPRDHAAILLTKEPHALGETAWAAPTGTIGVMAHAAFARPPAQSWVTPDIMDKAICAFTWSC